MANVKEYILKKNIYVAVHALKAHVDVHALKTHVEVHTSTCALSACTGGPFTYALSACIECFFLKKIL